MTTGHLNPGQGRVVTRLLDPKEEERVKDQFMLDEIRERARVMWSQSDGGYGSLPTTYQSHFRGQQVNCNDRTPPRPASTTRKHRPQSNKWFYTTTFNSLPAYSQEDSRLQGKDSRSGYSVFGVQRQDNGKDNKQLAAGKYAAEQREPIQNDDVSPPYEIDSRAAVEVLRELEQLSLPRPDGSTWRGDFSMRPEWKPAIRHHRLRPLSPPLPIQSHQ